MVRLLLVQRHLDDGRLIFWVMRSSVVMVMTPYLRMDEQQGVLHVLA